MGGSLDKMLTPPNLIPICYVQRDMEDDAETHRRRGRLRRPKSQDRKVRRRSSEVVSVIGWDFVKLDLQSPLGFGGFGQVFLGHKQSDGVPVAVKIISTANHLQLHLTVRALQLLPHPNLCHLYDVWSPRLFSPLLHASERQACDKEPRVKVVRPLERISPRISSICPFASIPEPSSCGTLVYIVQQLCSGPDLLTYLRDQYFHVLPGEARVREIVTPVLRGLDILHRHGWIHGDIKFENVMFQDEACKELRLIDLENCTRQDSPRRLCCTPQYAGPEVFQQRRLSPASDMRAVGCMCYAMLEGEFPHANLSAPLSASFPSASGYLSSSFPQPSSGASSRSSADLSCSTPSSSSPPSCVPLAPVADACQSDTAYNNTIQMTDSQWCKDVEQQLRMRPKFCQGITGIYSIGALDFLLWLLHNDPAERCPNASAALEHPWIAAEATVSTTTTAAYSFPSRLSSSLSSPCFSVQLYTDNAQGRMGLDNLC